MKSDMNGDAKTLYQLGMIAAYKGMPVAKAAAHSLGMDFDQAKIEKIAADLRQDREAAETALFEESSALRARLSQMLEQAAAGSIAPANPGIRPVVASFKALMNALGQRAGIELSALKAALTQSADVGRLAGATRAEKTDADNSTTQSHWRLDLIEEAVGTPEQVRLTLSNDTHGDALPEVVVLGVKQAQLHELTDTLEGDEPVMASDAVYPLWSGAVEPGPEANLIEISFPMPDGLKLTAIDSHYKAALQQDANGVWGVILKVELK